MLWSVCDARPVVLAVVLLAPWCGEREERRDEDKNMKTVRFSSEGGKMFENLWVREAEEVTVEEYASQYKLLSGAPEDYFSMKHFSVESLIQFRTVMYVPV